MICFVVVVAVGGGGGGQMHHTRTHRIQDPTG